jgi:hypothetical protein
VTLLARLGAQLDEPHHSDSERAVVALRSRLDAAQFEAAWQRGRTLTLEQLVALAGLVSPLTEI